MPFWSEERSASISASVLRCERLMRMAKSRILSGMPKAESAPVPTCPCDEQAEPLDTEMPSADKK